MTATELHNEIAATVRHRISESGSRTRNSSASGSCTDCGPAYTHDLLARLSLTRAPAGDGAPSAPGVLPEKPATAPEARTPERVGQSDEAPPTGALERMISGPAVLLAVAVAVGSLLVILGVGKEPPRIDVVEAESAAPVFVPVSQPRNLFNEATTNYHGVASGKLGVQVPGEVRRDVERHFASNGISHTVHFPPVPLPLAGGIVTRYGDRNVAQLVYAADEQAMYVLQVPTDELRRGTSLYVTQDVLDRLDKGQRIVEETPEGETIIVYRDEEVAMAVVSNIPRPRLEGLLKLK